MRKDKCKKNLNKSGTLLFAVLFPLILGSCSAVPVKDTAGTTAGIGKEVQSMPAENKKAAFKNPIMDNGPDPYVYRHTDGYYYFTATTGRNITIWKSKTLTGIRQGESKVIWTPPAEGPNSKEIWAPEVYSFDGKWYVYYTATDGKYTNRRTFVLENPSADIFADAWIDKGKIFAPLDKWAIDGTVLQHNGSMYFVWSGWEGDVRIAQNIYIAPMCNPWTISGERVLLSTPSLDWEKVRFKGQDQPFVNEGPAVLKRSGKIFIVYSASHYTTDDYCLGMLTALDTSDLLNAGSWKKSSGPVFRKSAENGIFGPGHNSFTVSADGKEDWIVYHAYSTAPSKGGKLRSTWIKKFTWKADGTPDFGIPPAMRSELEVPSGE